MARADARVAGLARRRRSSTSTRSRRSSATRTSTACRARGTRSSARRPPPRADAGRSRLSGDHILVIANETVASQTLLDAVRAEAGGDDRVTVIAPVNEPNQGYVVYEDTRRASAGPAAREDAEGAARGRALGAGLRRRDRAGAGGRRTRSRSSSRRSTRSSSRRTPRALGLDAPRRRRRHRAARQAFPSSTSSSSRGGRRDERARDREPDRRLGRAARPDPRARGAGPGELPDRRAAERRRGARRRRPAAAARAHASCAARASTRTARSCTPTRTPPRCTSCNDERVDEIIVSTFPGESSGWLRRDLVAAPAQGHRPARRARRRTGSRVAHERLRPKRTRTASTTARRRPLQLAGLAARCSACSSSSRRRSCSSARSSRSTSSTGSSTTASTGTGRPRRTSGRPSSPGINTLILVTSSFTMHWADTLDQEGQPRRAQAGHGAHVPARPHLPAHPDDRVPPDRLQHERHVVRGDVLRAHGPARRARVRRPDDPAA